MKMGGANRDFFKLSPLGQVAWTVYALETAVYQLDPAEEGWRLLFRMLWSFDQIGHSSYRDTLLLGIIPQDLLETPYCEEEYVDPPRAHCYTKTNLAIFIPSGNRRAFWELPKKHMTSCMPYTAAVQRPARRWQTVCCWRSAALSWMGRREAEAKRSSFGGPVAHTGQEPRLRCLSLGSSGSFEKAPARPVFSGEAMFQGGTGAASSVCVNRAFDGPADKIFRKTSCTEMGFLV